MGSGDEILKRRAVDASLEEAHSKSLSNVSLAAFFFSGKCLAELDCEE